MRAKDSSLARAFRSLDALSLGDAFGEQFFYGQLSEVPERIAKRELPRGRFVSEWRYTDDTVMALSVFAELLEGEVDEERLALRFAKEYSRDDGRGYGATARGILEAIGQGQHHEIAAGRVFGGSGSMGNGAAMRVAPLGVYFADDLDRCVAQARLSALPTHQNPEGVAGAIAVAVAAAHVTGLGRDGGEGTPLLQAVFDRTPQGATREGLAKALTLPLAFDVRTAVTRLGNGSKIIASDTVPICIWLAASAIEAPADSRFEDAMWRTVSALGDRDTTCAIVGGILGGVLEESDLPKAMLRKREKLPLWARLI